MDLKRNGIPPGILPKRKAKGHKESEEYWKAKEKEKWAKRWQRDRDKINARKRATWQTNAAFREKRKAAARERYWKNPEKEARRKTEWSRKNKSRYREQWNTWYQRVKDTKRGQQLASRIRNRPLYGLAGSLRDFENGIIGVDELTRRYDAALARVDEASRRRLQGLNGTKTVGQRQRSSCEANSRGGEGATQVDAPKTRHRKGAS